jgi:hypothetical protein
VIRSSVTVSRSATCAKPNQHQAFLTLMNNRFRINLPASVEGCLRHFGLRLTIFDRLRPKVIAAAAKGRTD